MATRLQMMLSSQHLHQSRIAVSHMCVPQAQGLGFRASGALLRAALLPGGLGLAVLAAHER